MPREKELYSFRGVKNRIQRLLTKWELKNRVVQSEADVPLFLTKDVNRGALHLVTDISLVQARQRS